MKKILLLSLLLILSNRLFCQNDSIHLSKLKLLLDKHNYFKTRVDVWSNKHLKSLSYLSRMEIPIFQMTLMQPTNFSEFRDSLSNFIAPKFHQYHKRRLNIICDNYIFINNEFIGHVSAEIFYKNFRTGQISEHMAYVLDSLDVIAGIELSTTQYPPYLVLLFAKNGLFVFDYEAGRETIVAEWTKYFDENSDRLKKYLNLKNPISFE